MKKAALLLAILFALAAGPAPPRIVAVGDVHGAYDAFVQILQKAGLIDATQNWVAGGAVLVQTGDVPDRGPKTREVMDLLMKLEQQAPKQGSRVYALLGNHEVMNLMGDLRYVSAEEYAGFADSNSVKGRQHAYRQYVEWKKKDGAGGLPPEPEEDWNKTHPPGFLEHRDAYSLDGKYGKWLRSHQTLIELNGILFMHGGLSPEFAKNKINTINDRILGEIKLFDRCKKFLLTRERILPFFTLEEMVGVARREAETLKAKRPLSEQDQEVLQLLEAFLSFGGWWSVHPNGPLWFRGFAQWTEEEGPAKIDQIVAASGARQFVVGHTPQEDGWIHQRFGARVFLIDTGMLSGYYANGRVSALEIQGGTFTAIYSDQKVQLFPGPVSP